MPVKLKNAARGQSVEPITVPVRSKVARTRVMEAFIEAIAKEDAKIMARASARALRRGLH